MRARLALALALVPSLAQAASPALRRLTKSDELPKSIAVPKGFLRALAWSDAAGENLLTFAAVESKAKDADGNDARRAALSAVHQVLPSAPGASPRTVRKVSDGVEPCPLDLTAEFIEAAEAVTDLDGDGVAEATFAYRTSCKGDVSPDTVKLLVLEGGDKYILRGDDATSGTPDPVPSKWPPAFLAHAKATWGRVAKGSGEEQALVDETLEADLATIAPDGKLGATKGVIVQLRCAGPKGDGVEVSCESSLTVTRGKRELARLERGVDGIHYRAVAGNRGALKLSRFDLGDGGAGPSLVVVESTSGEGDEAYETKSVQTLYALRGETLVEVLEVETVYQKIAPGTRATERSTTLDRDRGRGTPPAIVATTVEGKGARRRVVTWTWDAAAGKFVAKPSSK